MQHPTHLEFLDNVEDLEMSVTLGRSKVLRHLFFKAADSSQCQFSLVTWKGSLCISGDMGTFVFRRLDDMFQFFRHSKPLKEGEEYYINPYYWAEKLEGSNGGEEEFDPAYFIETLTEAFNTWDFETEEQQKETWEELQEEVLSKSSDGGDAATHAAFEFQGEYGHHFPDLWETSFTKYTYRFIWNLRAIVWGIAQFDAYVKNFNMQQPLSEVNVKLKADPANVDDIPPND